MSPSSANSLARRQPPPELAQYRGSATRTAHLRYLAKAPVVVNGPKTNVEYHFSGAQPVQPVAAADVELLLETGFFRREF